MGMFTFGHAARSRNGQGVSLFGAAVEDQGMNFGSVVLRSPRRRAALLSALVVGALAVGVALTLEAWRASRDHRRAVVRALNGYVIFSASAYRQQLLSRLYVASSAVFAPLGNARLTHDEGTPLPAVGALDSAAQKAIHCECGPALRPLYLFRYDSPTRSLETRGQSLGAEARARVVSVVSDLGELRDRRDWEYAALYDSLASRPQLIYVTAWRDVRGTPRAVYGFAVDLVSLRDDFLAEVLHNSLLLPITESRGLANDSLLSVAVTDSAGRVLVRGSARDYPATYGATITGGALMGFLTLRFALNPERAPDVLVGGLPPSRGPLLLGLLALVAGVIATLCIVAWRAAELARLRAEFVAGVSHELRTPLAQILLFGDSLRLGRIRARRDVESAGDVIVGESRRLIQLVENILLFGRAARGAVRISPEPLALAPLVRDVVDLFGPQAQASESHVRLGDLADVAVRADPNGIRQVLLNLLDNATKYGPPGQTIVVGLTLARDRAQLWVEDEGPGIPPEDRQRVWEPFARLERDLDANIAGSGIGLSVVRDIIGQHGGVGRIESTSGGSARFVIELPGAHARGSGGALTACAS